MNSENGNAIEGGIGVEIKVDPHYESLVPRMSDSDYNSLRESIRTAGQFTPIIVNKDYVVIDGHHRLRACRELDIAPLYEVRHFSSKSKETAFAIERNLTNLQHRRLNKFRRIELASRLEEIEAEKAHNRQVRTLKKGNKSQSPLSSIELNGEEKGRVAEKCAKIAGVSRSSYRRGRYIVLHGSEELKEQVRSGQLSISRACLLLMQGLPDGNKTMNSKRKPLARTDKQLRFVHLERQDIEKISEGAKHMTDEHVMQLDFTKYGIFDHYEIKQWRR